MLKILREICLGTYSEASGEGATFFIAIFSRINLDEDATRGSPSRACGRRGEDRAARRSRSFTTILDAFVSRRLASALTGQSVEKQRRISRIVDEVLHLGE